MDHNVNIKFKSIKLLEDNMRENVGNFEYDK